MVPRLSGLSLLLLTILFFVLLFGPKKLPEVASALGKTVREFIKGMNG